VSVGIVLVSHSALIAHGLVDLARQMAPTVALLPAGGSGDGTRDDAGIGTSFDVVSAALAEAEGGDGVVVLADLGSAYLTAETAVDMLDEDAAARVVVVRAPLVEGAVAAAVAAETGGSLEDVAAAAASAASADAAGTRTPGSPPIPAPTARNPLPRRARAPSAARRPWSTATACTPGPRPTSSRAHPRTPPPSPSTGRTRRRSSASWRSA
jgi:PTS hybrid protein